MSHVDATPVAKHFHSRGEDMSKSSLVSTNKPKPVPKWMLSLWERSSIEPAMIRAPIVILLFLVLWGINVMIFERLRFKYHTVLTSKRHSLSFVFSSAIALALLYLLILASLANYFYASVEIAILVFYALTFIMFLLPNLPGQEGRTSFSRLLYQVFFPAHSISFAEVILADIFTSLSKVFKDVGTTAIVLYARARKTEVVEHHELGMLLIALLASLPFYLRIRQCLVQLWGAPDAAARLPICLNTLKYVSGFPPIWLSFMASLGFVHKNLPVLIIIMATINSLFSYGWDLFMDWGFIAFCRGKPSPRRLIPLPLLLLACAVNLVLRLSWTANFFTFFSSLHPATLVFVVELAEIFRRWMWIIFRVEWEILVQTEKGLLKDKDEDDDDGISTNLLSDTNGQHLSPREKNGS